MSSKKLNVLVNELEKYVDHIDVKNLKISKSTIGWQIDHSLKVINNVTTALQNSDPKAYENNFKFLGKFFFFLGVFPRGKAKAPKHVLPPEVILKDDLIVQIQQAKTNIETLSDLDNNAFFKHPLFGNINRKRVHRFLELHTNHHVKIINDIIASTK